jgi:hypothetical protein
MSAHRGRSIAEEVAALEAERDALARRCQVLDAKLIELSDDPERREELRKAYRRGYFAGRAAESRRELRITNPEANCRGEFGALMRR